MNWLEESPLEFDTPIGPIWPAVKYLSVCAWPESHQKRNKLIWSLLKVSAEKAGYPIPWEEHRERVIKRIERATYRFNKHSLPAAEKARLKTIPPEWNIPVTFEHPDRYYIGKYEPGTLKVLMPSHKAIGRKRKVSDKRLDFLAAKEWKFDGDSCMTSKGNTNFRNKTWRPFRSVVHYVIGLQDYFCSEKVQKKHRLQHGQIPDLITLCRDTNWLEPALTIADRWATYDLPIEAGIPTESLIRLFRTP